MMFSDCKKDERGENNFVRLSDVAGENQVSIGCRSFEI